MTDTDNKNPEADLQDRFEAVRGKADIKWRTDDLMALLRGDTSICLKEEDRPGFPADPGATHISD
ncbi:hypothetical protein K9857_15600 [Pseudomonas sp. REP124]|uniref:hypothetical protein n=1 Tax=Pseudomonas sp. REP124 TaxID=2875731 RepID=UPI001CCA8EA7|nr:hypothetical protein [Pseudomonas sp. REP124]MBZ9782956.1 hypothetical protein [Pseudomonas sp. REP124]